MTSSKLAAIWRIEIYNQGRYWAWRKGSGKSRQYRYGGTFAGLSTARKEQYNASKGKARQRAITRDTAIDNRGNAGSGV